MKTIEYTNPDLLDREGWPAGEWDNEPDKIQWRDETTGFPCLIVRNRMGGLCGYVGVPRGHRFYMVDYDSVSLGDEMEYNENNYPPAHGGLTFSNKCLDGPENSTICHLPEPDDFACIHEARKWWNEREGADDAAQRHPFSRYCPDCEAIVSPDETYWLGFDCAHYMVSRRKN